MKNVSRVVDNLIMANILVDDIKYKRSTKRMTVLVELSSVFIDFL